MQKNAVLLITGASGYIASNFIKYCAENSDFLTGFQKIILLDRSLKARLTAYLQENKIANAKTYQIDFSQNYNLDLDLEENQLIYCIHTAKTKNLDDDKRFFEKLRAPCYMIYFSSAAVYGEPINEDQLKIPVTENSPTKPISDYGSHKLEVEKLVQEYFQDHLILRIANPYGKEDETKSVVALFEQCFKKIQPTRESAEENLISINAESANEIIRDFIYIDDFSKSVLALIKKKINGIINISSGKSNTLEELISLLSKKYKKTYKIAYRGYKKGDIKHSALDNSRLATYLDFKMLRLEETLLNQEQFVI